MNVNRVEVAKVKELSLSTKIDGLRLISQLGAK